MPGANFTPEGFESRHQRIGNGLRPAHRDRPADAVGEASEEQRDAGGDRLAQVENGVRSHAGEQCASLLLAEGGAHGSGSRPQAKHAELDQLARRLRRQPGRIEHGIGQPLPALTEAAEHALPGCGVAAELCRGLRCGAVQ